MKTSRFDFDLPPELIADRPVSPRDAARLLAVGDALEDRAVRDLPDLLRPGDVMVFNDTRVIPARLTGRRARGGTSATVEVTLHKDEGARDSKSIWRAFARPAKKLAEGDRIVFADGFHADVAAKGDEGEVTLAFNLAGAAFSSALVTHGAMPLPPYIKRQAGGDPADDETYQTVYAARDGAVAAPTAGLHLTDDLLAAIDARGVERVTVTLHVGAGTFLPVKVEDVADHRMHSEWGEVSAAAAEAINRARADGGRIVAVGTTSLRLLETAADDSGAVHPFTGETDIFITPGTPVRTADILMTNFHLPRSTLFMLVSAFAGLDRMQAAYAHAKAAGYRFYSYGDACWLKRGEE